jgi:hypothetical protein
VLNEHADEQARFDLFDRINTGSLNAEPPEIRRGALPGPFLDLVIDLATDPSFIALAPLTPHQIKVRDGEELVARFFAYGDGLEGYRDRVAEFLYAYSRKMNQTFTSTPGLTEQYRARFIETMTFVAKIFPYGFRTKPKGITTRKARFEGIAVGSQLALRERPDLAAKQIDVTGWLGGKAFRDVTGSDGANAIGRLEKRIFFVRDRLLAA